MAALTLDRVTTGPAAATTEYAEVVDDR